MSSVPATTTPAASLPLHDIHLPPAPAWWPPAPGWWLLAIVCLGVAGVLLRIALRHWHARRWRARVCSELERIATRHAAQRDVVRMASELSQLLRRATRWLRPEAVALRGEAWLDFLDAQLPRDEAVRMPFRQGIGRVLLDWPYRRSVTDGEADGEALLRLVRRWFAHALKARVAHV